VVPAALLTTVISANSVHAAPAALAPAATAVAITKGAAASSSTLMLIKGALKFMAWAQVKTSAVVTLATVVTLGASLGYAQFAESKSSLPPGKVTPKIEFGYSHAVVLAPDGSLWTLGDEGLGWPVLGLKKTRNTTTLRRIGTDNDWRDVSANWSHNLAIKADGSMWAWGANVLYELGDGTKITRQTPVRSVSGNDWKQASATLNNTSFALKTDGTLWGWGGNAWRDELGIGEKIMFSTNAVQIGDSTNWVKIWAGAIQNVALQSDGSLWFWGALNGSGTNRAETITAPTRVSPDTNWTDVCFGYFTVFAIKSDGTLWTWGNKAEDYSGVPVKKSNVVTPAQIGTDDDWQSCAGSGGFYTILRKKDGSFWAMDAAERRTVKKPSDYKPVVFKRLDIPTNLLAFMGGRDSTGLVMTQTGEVLTWGGVLGEHPPSDYNDKKERNKHPEKTIIAKVHPLAISTITDGGLMDGRENIFHRAEWGLVAVFLILLAAMGIRYFRATRQA
jgi:hypothetical protein